MSPRQRRQRALCLRAQKGDKRAADELTREVLPFVHKCARRVVGHRRDVDFEDVVAEGLLGVSQAIHKYRKGGGAFLAHAAWWIRANMRRSVSDGTNVYGGRRDPPRHQIHGHLVSVRKMQEEVEALVWEGASRDDSIVRVAWRYGMAEPRLRRLLDLARSTAVSLDAIHEENPTQERLRRLRRLLPNTAFVERAEVVEALQDAIDKAAMTDNERAILRRRFLDDDSVRELAEEMGCSKTNVWQIERRAIRKLRLALLKHPAAREYAEEVRAA